MFSPDPPCNGLLRSWDAGNRSNTPQRSAIGQHNSQGGIPTWLQEATHFTPTPPFVSLLKPYCTALRASRSSGHSLPALTSITIVFFGVSLMRFATAIATLQ
jgi:hypothetical protein